MDIRELDIFLSVAEHLHFGRASRACHLSPSALTRTVQRLEEEVGAALFRRDNRSVELSAAGERFRDYARRTVHDYRLFQQALESERALAGSLSLYASITAVYSLLPDLLEAYRQAYPGVHLDLRTGAAEQAVEQIENGEIDIAVAALPDRLRSGLEFMPIMTTPLVFIAANSQSAGVIHRQDGRLDLTRNPLVLPQTGLSRRRLEHWLRRHRLVPNISSEVSGNEAIVPMVHLGCGIGIVPQLVLERSPFRAQVRILDNAPQLESYVVGLCASRRNLKKNSVRALWDLAERQSAENVG